MRRIRTASRLALLCNFLKGNEAAAPVLTFAICFTFMTYLASSVLGLMIFVQRATWHAHSHGLRGTAHMTLRWQIKGDNLMAVLT